jgi:hypothetical protein
MRLTLTWSGSGSRLTATLAGPVSYAHRVVAMNRVADAAAERGISLMMVDFTLAWHLMAAPEDKASFFDALRARTDLAGARIAYVNCPEGNVAELQAVAAEIGFAARMFSGRSTAIDWLESSDEGRTRLVRNAARC